MFRSSMVAISSSLVSCGVAAAQPQTFSYFTGSCFDNVPCDITPSLPEQGFVLTDVISANSNGIEIVIEEVVNANAVAKVNLKTGLANGSNNFPSYHFNSGIPFASEAGIRIVTTDNAIGVPLKLTLVGYIPGTGCCPPVAAPAMGSLGLGLVAIVILAIGSVILRRRRAACA